MAKRLTELLAEALAKSQTDEGRREQHPLRRLGGRESRPDAA